MSDRPTGADIIRRVHPEWREHRLRWRWLLDSLEGGERYRRAIYGIDARGVPVTNLIRHKREYPDPSATLGDPERTYGLPPRIGTDPALGATDDDFALRQARTPVPTFLRDAIAGHLDEIYARDVKRDGPPALRAWWDRVDAVGVAIDEWMTETFAPLLMTLGQLDVLVDHPAAPEPPRTRADVERLGLGRAVIAIILPENLRWWRLAPDGTYLECIVQEVVEDPDGTPRNQYRHWTPERSTLYDDGGRLLEDVPHPYGRVPIRRIFDRRKDRCRHIGQPRYESVAERQREYYNRDSELILSDTTQAHPLLQGPEDYVQADGTLPIGPSWLLPKKKNVGGASPSYEGFDVVEFPKEGADSIRRNKRDIVEDIDRETAHVKAAGAATTTKGTSEQSGISKSLDLKSKHNKLAQIARAVERAERQIAELVLWVLADGRPDPADLAAIEVFYPQSFELYSAADVAIATQDFLLLTASSGLGMPDTETALLSRLFRLVLPGLSEPEYRAHEAEIRGCVEAIAATRSAQDRPLQIGSDLPRPQLVARGVAKGAVSDPTPAQQPPGQTGRKSANPPPSPPGDRTP